MAPPWHPLYRLLLPNASCTSLTQKHDQRPLTCEHDASPDSTPCDLFSAKHPGQICTRRIAGTLRTLQRHLERHCRRSKSPPTSPCSAFVLYICWLLHTGASPLANSCRGMVQAWNRTQLSWGSLLLKLTRISTYSLKADCSRHPEVLQTLGIPPDASVYHFHSLSMSAPLLLSGCHSSR